MSGNKKGYIKNTHLFDHDTTKKETNYPEPISHSPNKIKTILRNPNKFSPNKKSSKSLSKCNSSNNNNLFYMSGGNKNKNKKNFLQNFMYFNELNRKIKKIEVDKKYKNLIEAKNNDINMLQKEIEYYKNIVKNNKNLINNKIILPKNTSDAFLSTILINKKNNKQKINITTQSSYLYLKNSSSYEKYNNLKLLDLNKNNNHKFKSKENSNVNNLNIATKNPKKPTNLKKSLSNNAKIYFNHFKQKHNTMTITNIKRNNYLVSTKSCNKKKFFNSEYEMQINDLASFNNKDDINSIDSSDVSYMNELRMKRKFHTKIKSCSFNRNRNWNHTLYSNKNSLKNINCIPENLFSEEIESSLTNNNCYYNKEKFENVINRMENLFENLFSIVNYKKGDDILQNK